MGQAATRIMHGLTGVVWGAFLGSMANVRGMENRGVLAEMSHDTRVVVVTVFPVEVSRPSCFQFSPSQHFSSDQISINRTPFLLAESS